MIQYIKQLALFSPIACMLTIVAIAAESEVTRTACIGNSITMGARLSTEQSYPAKLSALLGNEYEVTNYGVGGACVNPANDKCFLFQAEMQQILASCPQIITIMLGTNDSQDRNWTNRSSFKANYEKLIDSLLVIQPNPRIFLCLPPPAFSQEHGIQNETIKNEVIPAIQEIAPLRQLPVIDTHTPFENHEDYYSSDGIHFDDTGTTVMAQTIYDALKSATAAYGIKSRSFHCLSAQAHEIKLVNIYSQSLNNALIFKSGAIVSTKGRHIQNGKAAGIKIFIADIAK